MARTGRPTDLKAFCTFTASDCPWCSKITTVWFLVTWPPTLVCDDCYTHWKCVNR